MFQNSNIEIIWNSRLKVVSSFRTEIWSMLQAILCFYWDINEIEFLLFFTWMIVDLLWLLCKIIGTNLDDIDFLVSIPSSYTTG